MENTQNIDNIVTSERRLEVLKLIRRDIEERIVRLEWNNEVFNDVIIPLRQEQKKDKPKELKEDIEGFKQQIAENCMGIMSNAVALAKLDKKINELK